MTTIRIEYAFTTAIVFLIFASGAKAADNLSNFDQAVGPFFQKYCLRCHDAAADDSEFRLDTLASDFADESIAQRWSEVVFRINAGEMPPQNELQPNADELGRVVEWISNRLKDGEAARMAKRGPVTHYRLSRDEYASTVYDLLGVNYDVHLPGAFNEDPRWHGFERIGSMLSLSPSHVDRYFKAAEVVLERAFPMESHKILKGRADAIEIRHRNNRKRLEEMGIAEKVRVPIWPQGSEPAFRGYWFGEAKESGIYRARIQLSGLRGIDGRAPHLSVWHNGLKRTVFDEDIVATEDEPVIIEFEVFLDMPSELDLRNIVPQAFALDGNHTLNVLNMGGSIFTSSKDTRFLNPTGYKLTTEDGRAVYPLLIVDWVEWEGPIVTQSNQKKREGLVPQANGDLVDARQCLKRFADRAWRRPATDAEVDRYVGIVEAELAAGEDFRSAYRAAMIGVLASKNFYYLTEGSASERRDRVNDWELASRLSYFLWGSMPDEQLFNAALEGKLREPEILRDQLIRMMNDTKTMRFTDTFPRQWLQLHKVGMFPPDPKLFPDYDLWLEKSMVMETTEFFKEVFSKDLTLRELLISDWTVVNPRLALHYKLPPPTASGFQRVELRPENHRGGLLTQAAVLMLTSDGTRHRPVHRGVWVSETIYGKTPPPPPPNVEPLAPTPNDKPKSTIREQLEAHATHATCASCHRAIDPLGFAFDNYDAIGRWRTEELVPAGQGDNPPVDASGLLPDGRKFSGPDEFKLLLAEDLDRFSVAFVEQLATYALRRVMTVDDSQQIRAIAAASKRDGYKLKSVIENFVMSDLFQKR